MLGVLRVLRSMVSARWAWFEEKSQTRKAEVWLGAYSLMETILLPFPVDPFLAVMIHTNRMRWLRILLVALIPSLIGSIIGYFIAFFSYDLLAQPIVLLLGIEKDVEILSQTFNNYVFVTTLIGAFTPIPYTPIIFAAGFLKVNFFTFFAASVLGRTIRFGIVTGITYFYGVSILPRLGKWASTVTFTAVFLVVVVLWFIFVFK